MTGRYLRSDAYTALWLTPLAPGVIARGLILSALYRVRLVLALMIVLIPGLAVHFYSGSLASARDGCYVFLSPSAYHEVESRAAYPLANRDACVGPSDPRLVLASLAYWLPMAVACWGVALLAVIAGVAVSLARPRVLGAVLFSLAILVAAVLIVALTGRFLGAVQACLAQRTASCTTFDVWPPQNMLSNSLLAVIKKVNPRLCGGDSHSLTNPERCRTSSA
jgi:small-conductance mechanosensitive channel